MNLFLAWLVGALMSLAFFFYFDYSTQRYHAPAWFVAASLSIIAVWMVLDFFVPRC